MRHAYLQPAGEDGLVARHRADRTCHPLPLSRPSIPRRLNKEIMMKKLALIATAAALLDRKSTRLNSVTNAHLVCRLLLEKKNNTNSQSTSSKLSIQQLLTNSQPSVHTRYISTTHI